MTVYASCEQHNDQGDLERAETLSRFHAIVGYWNHSPAKSSVLEVVGDGVEKVESKKSGLLVTADACLSSAALGEPSLGSRVLVHFDLRTKKVHCTVLVISPTTQFSAYIVYSA